MTVTSTPTVSQSSSSQIKSDTNATVLVKDDDKTAAVVVAEELTTELLEKVFNNEICVLRIPGFVPPETRSQLLKYLLEDSQPESLPHEVYDTVIDETTGKETKVARKIDYGVKGVGTGFNSVYAGGRGSAEWIQYFRDAEPMMAKMRTAAHPNQTPTDKLREQINELSPFGYTCEIPIIDGKSMFCGVARVLEAEDSARAEKVHFDSVPPKYLKIRNQFAANMYLQNSEDGKGGELQIWNVKPIPHEHVELAEDWDVGAEVTKLGLEPICVRPDPGDLLICSTRRPHAAGRFLKGTRVQVQCFMGITTGETPSQEGESQQNQQPKIVMWN